MSDPGNDDTERILRNMERKLNKIYSRATYDAQQKLQKYLERFAKKDEEKKALVEEGKLSQEDYIEWRKRQMVTGSRYKEMVNTLAEDYANTDKLAMSMVNGYMPEVYAINRNFSTYEIEHGSQIDINYTLYNRATVEKLIKEKSIVLPRPGVDVPKDQRWNRTHIRAEITQGILQGEAIPKIAKRLQKVSNMDRSAAVRNARTAVTGAQNGARIDTYRDAKKKGIGLKQRWVATLDMRTRHTHAVMDNELIDVGEKFSNGLRFPGDPEGEPSEVYNCRCRMVAHLTGFDFSNAPRNNKLGDMSYDEWIEMHRRALGMGQEEASGFEVVQGHDISQTWQRRPDKFDFAIEDIINAQGFDGLPRVVSSEEFEEFISQSKMYCARVYGADGDDAKNVVLRYQDSLYNRDFYVECSGGARYGRGMYCAYSRGTKETEYIAQKMLNYGEGDYNIVETFTVSKDAKIISRSEISQMLRNEPFEVKKNLDIGEYAALKGYDGIDVDNGEENGYLVILNRTKCIFRKGATPQTMDELHDYYNPKIKKKSIFG